MEVKKFFESRFGSALTSGVEETSREYSKEKLDGEDLRMDMRMDLNTRVLYGDSYPYSEELRKARFTWCPPFWRYLTKAEKNAKWKEECERDAELARQAKAKLELDPVYKEEQLEREVEREALAQRRRDKEAAEAQRRRDELQARRDQMDMWYEGRKIAESRQKQRMSNAVEALQRLMKNERCSEASRKAYVKQLAAAQAGTLNKQKAESVVFLAGSL